MTGQTSAGETFQREALLLVTPGLDQSAATGNGVNARDIAIRSGNPGGMPEAGALWFATNTSLYDPVGIPSTIDASNVDVAFVDQLDQNTLRIVVDGSVWGLPNARTTVLNNFNARSGFLANVYQVIQGAIVLQFTNGGATVQGQMTLVGNGYIEPGSASITATLSGTAVQV